MKQYICDRCGVEIPIYDHYHHIIIYDKDIKYHEYDLCDDCLEYLHNMNQAFIENRELFVK